MLLRAIMYPNANGTPANPCYDSSPEFTSKPLATICRGQEVNYTHGVQDLDADSLIYSWSAAYNSPIASPVLQTYKTGFFIGVPTPDTSFDLRNIPSTLNRTTGQVNLAVYSGSGVEKFTSVIRVDAYKNGSKTATVFREVPIAVTDCPV